MKVRFHQSMQRVVFIAACLLAAHTGAYADRLADAKQRGTLICATLTANEPLGFPDPNTRQIVGFDVDMCDAVAKQLGLKLEHKGVSVEARVPELALGRVDVVSAAFGYTKERAEQVDFTASDYQVPIKLIVPIASGLSNINDLHGKKISAIKGSTLELFSRRALPDATVLTFQDGPAAFLALSQGKVQAMAQTMTGGIRYVNETEGKYKFADGELAWEPTALGVKKGEPALLAAVNDALSKMEAAGTIDAIWKKWYGPQTKYNIPREKKLTPIETFK
jgi:polar amino acid transport system substrate-binding protein